MPNSESCVTVRRVVSNFIFHTDAHGCRRLLLLKRSDKVRNYRGLWCTVSGSIADSDVSPYACAVREIAEETGLEEQQLAVVHQGSEMTVHATDRNIDWVVTPFMWNLTSGDVAIDWEHTEYKWILPEKLGSYELVPDLIKTYQHVLDESQ
ncbi:Translation initiation factor eIF-2B subunit family protein [Taphrina deformans PYCC 5710]|uniref:Translation initiation factor eIF-2B subunit family protein n=1 Tax=Taphrina deformans (strain PYCC 5710 / ATCC 11124 / CBS 356.35 / IMI 108563 / JCM 9778 / NBRC 8474) TaxID=1097556 RepID=R4X8E4_TAPDE|nr:Translation initiation factor eIF-2B subunit family protein [Taphrina deformans PYCC 5710]|eukprot:CCG81848.1 Translation initiation factor eIF-2B subunit family protein [Taphrina deformans PYCC 5710]